MWYTKIIYFYKILLTKRIFIYIWQIHQLASMYTDFSLSYSSWKLYVFDLTKWTGSWESFVWESDYTGCSGCFWLTEKNRFIRVIRLGIPLLTGCAECFWLTKKNWFRRSIHKSHCLFWFVDSLGSRVAVTFKYRRNLRLVQDSVCIAERMHIH